MFKYLFRFSIRDVLWLTLVVALAVGWYTHYRQYSETLRHAQQEFSEKVRQANHDNRELLYRLATKPSPFDG